MASSSELPEKTLPVVKQYTTTHTAEGKPTFATNLPEETNFVRAPICVDINPCYMSDQIPVPLGRDADLAQQVAVVGADLGVPHSLPQGALIRYIDFHPQCPVVWHRSVTVDVGVIVEGEIELLLSPTKEELEKSKSEGEEESKHETRLLRRGDVFVQRGTNHAWRNPSATNYARMFCVVLGAEPVVVHGQPLEVSMPIVDNLGGGQQGTSQ